MSSNPPVQVDARGYRCPVPVLRLQRALRDISGGDVVILLASDPMARVDVPFFCEQAGHVLQDAQSQADCTAFTVIKSRSTSAGR